MRLVVKVLALCPDGETRGNFLLDIAEGGTMIPSISRPRLPKEEEEARRRRQ